MAVATKKLTCQSCGARSSAELTRCRVCTRPLPRSVSPTQEAFEEDLYGRPVGTAKIAFGDLHPVAVVLLLVALVGLVNYQFLGYGPDWAHKSDVIPVGSSWRGYDGDGWSASLPPNVGTDVVTGPDGAVHRTWAGVDAHWDTVAGGGTLAPATAARASTDLVAEVVVAEGAAPADVMASAADLLGQALPGAKISGVDTASQPKGTHDQVLDLTANFDGGISVASHGGVVARVYVDGGRYYLLGTFTPGGVAHDIHDKLVTGFTVAPGR